MEGLVWFMLFAGGAVFVVGVYLVPTAVVLLRRRPNPMPVIVVNVLLGWTLLGWVAALAMAFHSPVANTVVVGGSLSPTAPDPRASPVVDAGRGVGPGPRPGGP